MTDETIKQKENIVSLGKKLANLRQELGLTQREVASQIHVRTSIIEDIENDRVINVPPVFLKGYIKNYATIVGLPVSEYQAFLDSQMKKPSTQVMKNYSNKEQTKRHSKRLLTVSLLIILMIIGVTAFLVWKDNKSELVEVTHYISPPTANNG